jgi:DNA-binding transcriptional LysR family regulator
MNVRFLETFVWLAKLRNFRLTAERLHATQAAISSRISALEQEFGVRLFDRGPRDVKLTQEGTKALAFAEQILKLTNDMLASVSDRSHVSGYVAARAAAAGARRISEPDDRADLRHLDESVRATGEWQRGHRFFEHDGHRR